MLQTGNNPRGTRIAPPAPSHRGGQTVGQVVHDIFSHQNPKGQAAIFSGVIAGKADRATTKAVLEAWNNLSVAQKHLAEPYIPVTARSLDVGKLLSSVDPFKDLTSGNTAGLPGGPGIGAIGGRAASEANVGGKVGSALVRAPIDIGRAAVEDPSVIPKTIKGIGAAAVGGLAGLASIPQQVIEKGPGQAFSNFAKAMSRDYSNRYGALYSGNDQAFIDRLKKQGAGPEVLDALLAGGALDATVGRAATKLGQTGEKLAGREAGTSFLTRPRPGLRTSGSDVRAQKLAPGAIKITAQRAEDRLRAAKEAKRPGEIAPAADQVRPLFGNRSQRVLASQVSAKYRRVMQQRLNDEVRKSAQQSIVRLSAAEKRAAPVVLEGFIPLDRGAQAARDAIDARLASIVKYRGEHPKSAGNHIPAEFKDRIDEVQTLQALRGNVEKWLTPRLARFVHAEGARAARLEKQMPDSYLRQPVAEARRLRPQGEALGIEHPDVINARLADKKAGHGRAGAAEAFGATLTRARETAAAAGHSEQFTNFENARPGLLQDYSARVRAAAQAKGLPEPAYVPHRDVPAEKLGNFTSGTGHRAMPAPKRSQFELFNSGAVDRHHTVYTSGLARGIKAGHQWPLVDEQMRRSAFPEPSAKAIKAAGFGARAADKLTGREYLRAMMFDGHKADNVTLYNPGRLRESTLADRGLAARPLADRAGGVPPELESDPMLHDMLAKGAIHGKGADASGLPPGVVDQNDPFLKTTGWKGLPPSAYKEIHSSLQPSGLGGGLVGKAQGGVARLILGGSPSFLVMNTLAHMVLAGFGTRGRILTDAVKFPLWWQGLSDTERNVVRANPDDAVGVRG